MSLHWRLIVMHVHVHACIPVETFLCESLQRIQIANLDAVSPTRPKTQTSLETPNTTNRRPKANTTNRFVGERVPAPRRSGHAIAIALGPC